MRAASGEPAAGTASGSVSPVKSAAFDGLGGGGGACCAAPPEYPVSARSHGPATGHCPAAGISP